MPYSKGVFTKDKGVDEMRRHKKRNHIRWDRVAMVALVPMLALVIFGATYPSNVVEYENKIITVHKGDTLWGIAKDAVGEEEDVRQVIQDIIKNNNLKDGNIRPGMQLKVKAVKR